MSRIAPQSHDPVEIVARRSFTAAQRKTVFDRQNGLCAASGAPLTGDRWQIDHIIPLALGGTHETSNWEGLSFAAHAKKTARDIAAIAKAKRLAGEIKNGETKNPIRSRGFDKTKTRGFDGKVRERNG